MRTNKKNLYNFFNSRDITNVTKKLNAKYLIKEFYVVYKTISFNTA